MDVWSFFWDDEDDPNGNVEHIAEHDDHRLRGSATQTQKEEITWPKRSGNGSSERKS